MQGVNKRSFIENGRVISIPLELIAPNPAQPRRIFEPESLMELAASIEQYGIIQPLSVRKRDDNYELVAGERRLRAAKLAGLTEVPCIVLGVSEEESSMLALVENLQRKDLDFIEEAEGLARLMRIYGLSQEQAAIKVGKSQSAVANKLRILRHSHRIIKLLRESRLSERHARALLRIEKEEDRYEALKHIVEHKMTVAETEGYIDKLLKKPEEKTKEPRTLLLRDIRFFINSVTNNLQTMKSAGVDAGYERQDTEDNIILTITIPKMN